jgi:hypothetical protein
MNKKPLHSITPLERKNLQICAAIARSCGDCHVCCDVFQIDELHKACWTPCIHCDNGCKIHKSRPKVCRLWFCYWALKQLPETCRPDKCGFIIECSQHPGKKVLTIWETMPGTFNQKSREITEIALYLLKKFNHKDLIWNRYGCKLVNNSNGSLKGGYCSIKKDGIDFHYYIEPGEVPDKALYTHYHSPIVELGLVINDPSIIAQ